MRTDIRDAQRPRVAVLHSPKHEQRLLFVGFTHIDKAFMYQVSLCLLLNWFSWRAYGARLHVKVYYDRCIRGMSEGVGVSHIRAHVALQGWMAMFKLTSRRFKIGV